MGGTIAGNKPGMRQLNGEQTTGRAYRNLSQPGFAMLRTNNIEIAVRDGTVILADLLRPDADGRFPALLSFSPYPRQIQNLGAPLGFIEAGASDFFVPRGSSHSWASACCISAAQPRRTSSTSPSECTPGCFAPQNRSFQALDFAG